MRKFVACILIPIALSCGGPLVPSQEVTDLLLATQDLDLIKEVRIKNYLPSDKAMSLFDSRGPYFVPFMGDRPKGVLVLPTEGANKTIGYRAYLVDDGQTKSELDLSEIGPEFDRVNLFRTKAGWPNFDNAVPAARHPLFTCLVEDSLIISDGQLVVLQALDPALSQSAVAMSTTQNLPRIKTNNRSSYIPLWSGTEFTQAANGTLLPNYVPIGFPTLSGRVNGTELANALYFRPDVAMLCQYGASFSTFSASFGGNISSNALPSGPLSLMPLLTGTKSVYVSAQTSNTGIPVTTGDFGISFVDGSNKVRSVLVSNSIVTESAGSIILHRVGPTGLGKIALEIKDNYYYMKNKPVAPNSQIFRYTTWASDFSTGSQWAIFAQILVNHYSGETVLRTYAKKY